jgi:hypothetical protein
LENRFSIDINNLRDIAVSAAAERASLEGAQIASSARKIAQEKIAIRSEAKALVESIPFRLEEAAKTPIPTETGRLVQALIPIVNERIDTCMSIKGSMTDRERKLLAVVRGLINKVSIDGAEVFIHKQNKIGTYSNHDGDSAEGPCRHYFICAQVQLDR